VGPSVEPIKGQASLIPPPRTLPFAREVGCRFTVLGDQVLELEYRHGTQGVRELPAGLQRLLLVATFDREVAFGGLWGFLAGVSTDEGIIACGPTTLAALTLFQAHEAAALLEQAIGCWTRFVDSAYSGTTLGQKRTKEDIYRLKAAHEQLEQDLEPLTEQYQQLRAQLAQKVNAYISSREEEFVRQPSAAPNVARAA
jgi:hypothetical protein